MQTLSLTDYCYTAQNFVTIVQFETRVRDTRHWGNLGQVWGRICRNISITTSARKSITIGYSVVHCLKIKLFKKPFWKKKTALQLTEVTVPFRKEGVFQTSCRRRRVESQAVPILCINKHEAFLELFSVSLYLLSGHCIFNGRVKHSNTTPFHAAWIC